MCADPDHADRHHHFKHLTDALGGLGTIGLLGGVGLGIKNVGINTLVAY